MSFSTWPSHSPSSLRLIWLRHMTTELKSWFIRIKLAYFMICGTFNHWWWSFVVFNGLIPLHGKKTGVLNLDFTWAMWCRITLPQTHCPYDIMETSFKWQFVHTRHCLDPGSRNCHHDPSSNSAQLTKVHFGSSKGYSCRPPQRRAHWMVHCNFSCYSTTNLSPNNFSKKCAPHTRIGSLSDVTVLSLAFSYGSSVVFSLRALIRSLTFDSWRNAGFARATFTRTLRQYWFMRSKAFLNQWLISGSHNVDSSPTSYEWSVSTWDITCELTSWGMSYETEMQPWYPNFRMTLNMIQSNLAPSILPHKIQIHPDLFVLLASGKNKLSCKLE